MRKRGINYDTGVMPTGVLNRPEFDHDVVRREMAVIARDLHCRAVRITGAHADRIAFAAECAIEQGLEVWFSPFPCNLTPEEMLPYFADCADRAEKLRERSDDVVLVLGCEFSLFAAILPGANVLERIANMSKPETWTTGDPLGDLRRFFVDVTSEARRRFHGRLTYAAGEWEDVDWSLFDLVSIDAYRSADNAGQFLEIVRKQFEHGKPVAVTEFGSCTYQGAADRGGQGWAIVEWTADPPRLTGEFVRDESVQTTYFRELLDIFEAEGVDTAFWFTFAAYGNPYAEDPAHDLDMASYGVVKVLSGQTDPGWAPKAVFHAMAERFAAAD
jgi:hypothetical protein